MLARLPVLVFGLAGPALAAPPVPPPPLDVVPVGQPRETHVLTWRASDVTCGAGTRIAPAVRNAPEPQQVMTRGYNGPSEVTVRFDLDAGGRPFNMSGVIEPRSRLQARDIMPSLRASRFVVDAPQTGCSVRYTPQIESAAQAPPETLARFGVAQRLRMGKDVWDRLAPGDCRERPRVAPLTRSFPDFRKLARQEGARQWTYVRYDLDSAGMPVNLVTGPTSGYDALDAEALRAVAAGRYAGGARTGCVQAWWTGPETIPAPPIPPQSETAGNPACEIADRWAREPVLTYPDPYRQRAIEGWAILRFDVAPWGEIGEITVLAAEPSSEIGEAAINVLRRARLKPREGGLSGCVDRVIFRIRADETEPSGSEVDTAVD